MDARGNLLYIVRRGWGRRIEWLAGTTCTSICRSLTSTPVRGSARRFNGSRDGQPEGVKKKLCRVPRLRFCVPGRELFPCLNEYADGGGFPSIVIPSGGVLNDSAAP